jgi:hypothetical protein
MQKEKNHTKTPKPRWQTKQKNIKPEAKFKNQKEPKI